MRHNIIIFLISLLIFIACKSNKATIEGTHRYHKLNLRTSPIRHILRQIIPLPSRMTPNPRLLNLDLSQHPVPAEI